MNIGKYKVTQLQHINTIEGKPYTFTYNIGYGWDSSIECVVKDFSRHLYDETGTYIVAVEDHPIDLEDVDDESAVITDGLKTIEEYVIKKGYERNWWK